MRVFSAMALAAVSLSNPGATQTTTQTPAQTAPRAAAAPNTTATTTYHNDTLHLSYTYPASYTDASALAGPALEAGITHDAAGNKDLTRCVSLPFSAMGSAHGLAVVLLVRADAGCMKKNFTPATLAEFTRGEVQGLSASGAHTQFGEPVAFTTGGHSAELLQGTFAVPTGGTMYATVACVLLKPDVACWQFIASSAENINTMSAFPVSLDGAAPTPLVPAEVMAKH